MIVLGQVVAGVGVAQLKVGMAMELVLELLSRKETPTRLSGSGNLRMSASQREGHRDPRRRHAPLGQVGENFVEYGVIAARAALADAGVDWRDSAVRLRRRDHALRLSGVRCRRDVCAGAGLAGRPGQDAPTPPAPRVRRRWRQHAREDPRRRLRRRAGGRRRHHARKGFLAPQKGERPDDPDWVRFRLGITNPDLFRALCAPPHGILRRHVRRTFARVKVKNAEHGFCESERTLSQEVLCRGCVASAMVPIRCA